MQRYRYLDGVRGVAALIVVICHFFQFFLPAAFFESAPDHLWERWLAASPFNIVINGSFAVAVFFVISGFVLSAPAFSGKGRQWYVIAAVRRYPRLAIPAAASTALAWVAAKTIGFHYAGAALLSGSPSPNTFAAIHSLPEALWQGAIGAFFYKTYVYNRVLWTIGMELIGSFMVYLTVPFISHSRVRFVAYAAAIFLLRDSYLLGFVFGTLCADFLIRTHPRQSTRWLVLLLAGLYFGSYPYYGATAGLWKPLASMFRDGGMIVSHTVGGALCVLAIAQLPFAVKCFESRAAAFLGRVSYSLYLVHFTYWASAGSWLVVLLAGRFSYGTALAITMLVSLPVLFALAFAFARLIDEPTISLMHRLRLPGKNPVNRRASGLK
jgi:peptidoglycan/LPS O-acetylase OafA/YrhL